MGGEVNGAAGSPIGNLGLGYMGNPNMGYPNNGGTPYGYASGGEVQHFLGGGPYHANMINNQIDEAEMRLAGAQEAAARRAEVAVQQEAGQRAAADVRDQAPGIAAVAANPWSNLDNSSKSTTYIGIKSVPRGNPTDLLYTQKKKPVKSSFYEDQGYAQGGEVDDSLGMDDYYRAGGPLDNGFQFASGGGVPRFLSGGGDGMSDSIKASIDGSQEARLADGEFVIPADVVSHLGNGSSKAGAKQLYSMMDKVRKARTGTKKQGKQINPRKYLAA